MCSNATARIARICAAIEELAGLPGEEDGVTAVPGEAACPGPAVADDDVAGRLAAIWAMIAEVDPELAKRLPGYLAVAE